MTYRLHFRYVYAFYNFGEMLVDDIIEEYVEVEGGKRFTLHQQEDGSFAVSEVASDSIGKFVVLTFPGKDNLVVRLGEECELVYDEYYSVMGDDNHNVYEGTVVLGMLIDARAASLAYKRKYGRGAKDRESPLP